MVATKVQRDPDEIDPLYSVPEAADYIGSTQRFIRRLIAERRIEYYKLGGHVRIARSELERFKESGRVRAQ